MNGALSTREICNGNDECAGTIFLIITADSLVQRIQTGVSKQSVGLNESRHTAGFFYAHFSKCRNKYSNDSLLLPKKFS
jgi:hypothetical protein